MKLSGCTDREITQALELYSGEFFPSVDAVMEIIERRRERTNEEKGEAWGSEIQRNYSEIDKFKAAHDGKTPIQVYCEENREELNRLDSLIVEGARRDRSEPARNPSLNEKLVTSKTGKAE